MIFTTCPNCGFEKNFDDKYAGKKFKCPNCSTPVKIEIKALDEEPKKDQEAINEDIHKKNTLKSDLKYRNYFPKILLGVIGVIILTLLIYRAKDQDISNNKVAGDTAAVNSNKVYPEYYSKSKEVNNPIQYEIGYYKKKYQGSQYGIIFLDPDGNKNSNQYLNDAEVIKIDKIVNGFGFLSYENEYGWIKMEDLIKTEYEEAFVEPQGEGEIDAIAKKYQEAASDKYLEDIQMKINEQIVHIDQLSLGEKTVSISKIFDLLKEDSRIINKQPYFSIEIELKNNSNKQISYTYDFGTQVSLTTKSFFLK
jgi:hypothetical protein